MPDTIKALSDDQRYSISDAMTAEGLNKCFDCCLVPTCGTCGPCTEHDDATEAEAALAWGRRQPSEVLT